MTDDWRYTPERMRLRGDVLLILLKEHGDYDRNNGNIYECAHDWVSGGNKSTEGVLKFYEERYLD